MKFNILILLSIFVISCTGSTITQNKSEYIPYKSSGFALIYNPNLHQNEKFYKKIDNENLEIGHNILKKNSILIITNPENMKSIEATLRSRHAKLIHASDSDGGAIAYLSVECHSGRLKGIVSVGDANSTPRIQHTDIKGKHSFDVELP